jgi:hypothetical protein
LEKGTTPIKCDVLIRYLDLYPNRRDADYLRNGFENGFPLGYSGPREPFECKNLKSVNGRESIVRQRLLTEVEAGRMSGPFVKKPISNLRVSPIGLVPKRTGGFRLITHMSYPYLNSVNDFIDSELTKVRYSDFDNAVHIVKRLGKGTWMGKMDLKNAFRLLPCYPGDFDLLGIKLGDLYFIDRCMPMGCSISCSTFETFSKFLEWAIKIITGSDNIDHYLDDFIFMATLKDRCKFLLDEFSALCLELGVPVADEKTVGPVTCITYLGYELDSELMEIRIPQDKIISILGQIDFILSKSKVTLRQLQSLTGSLVFCTKAMPSARAFVRRMYSAMSHATRPHHKVRVTKGIQKDIEMWKLFLTQYNGVSVMLENEWLSNSDLQLFTDSAGNSQFGCGVYFMGAWAFLKWPEAWMHSEVLSDITYLEMVPIALACYLWKERFCSLKICFNCDNMAVVQILNSKSSKSERVMSLVRQIVMWSMQFSFHIKAVHVPGVNNKLVDSISRMQWETFRQLAPDADTQPTPIPQAFWTYLKTK